MSSSGVPMTRQKRLQQLVDTYAAAVRRRVRFATGNAPGAEAPEHIDLYALNAFEEAANELADYVARNIAKITIAGGV